MLSEYTEINTHAINLEEDMQPPYELIYIPGPMELETLKTYIKTSLVNGFILPSNALAGAPILFDRKHDRSFSLFVNYHGLNNLSIKNRYLFLLIEEFLDRSG